MGARGILLLIVGAVVLAAALVGAGGLWYWDMYRDWVSASTIEQLSGANPDGVLHLLGEPDERRRDPNGTERWLFRRPSQLAEFCVDFSSEGRVTGWSYDR